MKLGGRMGDGPRRSPLNVGAAPDTEAAPGILYHFE